MRRFYVVILVASPYKQIPCYWQCIWTLTRCYLDYTFIWKVFDKLRSNILINLCVDSNLTLNVLASCINFLVVSQKHRVVSTAWYLNKFVIFAHSFKFFDLAWSELSESFKSKSQLAFITETTRVNLIMFWKKKWMLRSARYLSYWFMRHYNL